MQVTKAVITAAGRGARQYPVADTVQKAMLPFVDRDGLTKPVLQIIAEEAIESGIEEICVVCAPGDEAVYRQQFCNYAALLQSSRQLEWAEEHIYCTCACVAEHCPDPVTKAYCKEQFANLLARRQRIVLERCRAQLRRA